VGTGPSNRRRERESILFTHGANEGFRNVFAAYENAGEGVVVMTNGDNGGQLGEELMRRVATEYHWPDRRQ
jgi:hypothetical protein